MTRPVFLGIDQGTRSTKAVLLDPSGGARFEESISVTVEEPSNGSVRQDPEELLHSVEEIFDRADRFARSSDLEIAAFGIACQRSGVCAWEEDTGRVRHPLMTWADTSTVSRIEALGPSADAVRSATTMPISSHYAAPKIAALQEQFPEANVRVGTLDSYLLHRLLDGAPFVTDDSMASRTLLYATAAGDWCETLCATFGVNRLRLPAIGPSLGSRGSRHGVRLTALLGDQQSGLMGRRSYGTDAVLTLGSIASLCVPLGEAADTVDGYVTSVYFSAERKGERIREYQIEGVSNNCAALIEELLRLRRGFGGVESISAACERAREQRHPAQCFLAPGGSATPEWAPAPKPYWVYGAAGADDGCARAMVENIGGFVIRHLLDLRECGIIPGDRPGIAVTGGASRIDYLLEYISAVSGCELLRSDSAEGAARGAAIAAMRGAGVLADGRELNVQENEARIWRPDAEASSRYRSWARMRRSVLG